MSENGSIPVTRTDVLRASAALILVMFPAWCWTAARTWSLVLVAVASVVLLLLLLRRRRFLHDGLFLPGVLFLAYLGVQAWFSGRFLYLDLGTGRWMASPPPQPGFPSSFVRLEALEMFAWFGPAWLLALALRDGRGGSAGFTLFVRLVWTVAALLAVLGLAQRLAGMRNMFGLVPQGGSFFASFGYSNQAASFFILAAGLAGADLVTAIQAEGRSRPVLRIGARALGFLLCLTGAHASLSRAGMLMALVLLVVTLAVVVQCVWAELRIPARVDLALASAALVLAAVLAGAPTALTEIRRAREATGPDSRRALGDRPLLVSAALAIWRDHPAYGVGGWGFRHLLPLQVPKERLKWAGGNGRANVHCDPVQFLAEFGVVGVALLLVAIGVLLRAAWLPQGGVALLPAVFALLLVAAHGFIDLPFRHPAVLALWTGVFAGLPAFARPGGAAPNFPARMP